MKQNKTLVVLVDDDAPFLRALGRLVSLAGFETLAFSRSADVLQAHLPDHQGCMVLDLFMPEMDGVTLVRSLRTAGNQLPVIVMTGGEDESLLSQIDHVAVLYKPFAISELLKAIASATRKSTA